MMRITGWAVTGKQQAPIADTRKTAGADNLIKEK